MDENHKLAGAREAWSKPVLMRHRIDQTQGGAERSEAENEDYRPSFGGPS